MKKRSSRKWWLIPTIIVVAVLALWGLIDYVTYTEQLEDTEQAKLLETIKQADWTVDPDSIMEPGDNAGYWRVYVKFGNCFLEVSAPEAATDQAKIVFNRLSPVAYVPIDTLSPDQLKARASDYDVLHCL